MSLALGMLGTPYVTGSNSARFECYLFQLCMPGCGVIFSLGCFIICFDYWIAVGGFICVLKLCIQLENEPGKPHSKSGG